MKETMIMKLLRKRVIIPLIVLVLAIALILVTPKLVSYVKGSAYSLIDYAAEAFETNTDEDEVSDETTTRNENFIQDDFSNNIIEFTFGSEMISFNTNYTHEEYELDSLFSDRPLKIKFDEAVNDFADNLQVFVNQKKVTSGDVVEVVALTKESIIEVELNYDGLKRKYFIQALPDDFPVIQKYKVSPYPGDYYSNFYLTDSTYLYKMSNEGELLYYKRAEGNRSLTNFAKWDIDGEDRYSYFKENNHGKIDMASYSFGDFVILNEDYEEIDAVHSLPTDRIEGNTTEAHDFIMLDDGHYLVMDYVMDNPAKGEIEDAVMNNRVLAAYVQEIVDGEVAWEWISTDHPELYASSVDGNDFLNEDVYAADYVHMNSMFIDPSDGNIIMSMRNLDSVIKIDKENNEILWQLGGALDDFNLSDEQSPSRQHHATITETGNLILFDNGTKNSQSRVLEFELDEAAKEVISFEEFTIEGAFGEFTGSVQKLDEENDVFLIGWGMRRNQQAMMSEIDFKNDSILSEIIDPEMEYESYRFMKFE